MSIDPTIQVTAEELLRAIDKCLRGAREDIEELVELYEDARDPTGEMREAITSLAIYIETAQLNLMHAIEAKGDRVAAE